MKCLGVGVCLALVWAVVYGGKVVVLTDENYESYTSKGVAMVKFFAPWCGHCKAMTPEYEKLAEKAEEIGKGWVIAELDATAHSKAASKNTISGYPTIKLFIDGSPIDYDGDRKADNFLSFIESRLKTTVKALESKEAVEEVVKSEEERKVILVSDDSEEMKTFVGVARGEEDYAFYQCSEGIGKEVFPELEVLPSIVLLKNYDERKAVMRGRADNEKIKFFLKRHRFPVMGVLDKATVNLLFQKPEKKGIIYIHSTHTDRTRAEEQVFLEFATKNQVSDILYISGDVTSEWGKPLLRFFGLEESSLPLIEVVDMTRGELVRYRFENELNVDNLVAFLTDYKKGKLERFVKSEPIPDPNSGPVFKAVGKNWNKEVIDNDFDVLVKFHAPWCGHCKAMAPAYQELAKELLNEGMKIKLAEIDMTKNDVAGVHISGYPTLKLFVAGKKDSPVDFSGGDRSKESLRNFLQSNAANYNKKVDL